jgi:hypothetical protein
MEGLESFYTHLNDIEHQAGVIAQAAVSLSQSFEAEAQRLTRQDEVQQLKTIHAAIVEKLAWSSRMECAASYGHNEASLDWALAGFTVKLVTTLITENQRAHHFVDQVFDTSKRDKCPYGMVMVCVGPKGIPDDIQVVSISELARESNQPEFEIMQKLQNGGSLVLSQDAFTRLIDRLITDIREGRLHLPIIGNKLSEMVATGYLRLESKQLQ